MKRSIKQSIKRSMGELIQHGTKRFALRAAAVFTVCGLLTGCAAQDGFARTALESRSNDSVRVPTGTNMAYSSSADGNCFFNEEEYAKLRALQWDGYEEMSVFDYQKAVWSMTDTWEYHDLLERLSKDRAFYEGRDYDETAAFFFYVLEPLSGERWRTRGFGGCAVSCGLNEHPLYADNALLEFDITLTILDEKKLTVGEYNAARIGMTEGMRDVLRGKTDLQLQDEALMREIIDAEVEELTGQWGSENLEIVVEYVYMPLSAYETCDNSRNGDQQSGGEEGSAAYEKLLSYKTNGYLSLSVAEFNALIAPTRDAFGEALEAYAEVTISKEDENNDFFDVTLRASLSELYGEVFEEAAYFSVVLSRKERPYVSPIDGYVFYEFLFYANVDIEYHVTSPETLTVAERDRVLRSCREELQSYVDGLSEEQILYGDIRAALTRKAAELERRYAGDGMELSIGIGHIDMIV